MAQNNKLDLMPAAFEKIGSGMGYRSKVCRMLEATRLFSDMAAKDIETLAQYMDAYTAPEGATLFAEGAQSNFMCAIVEGQLDIFKDSGRGNTRKIAELNAGQSVGEMSMIDGNPRSATAIVEKQLVVVTLRRSDLDRMIDEQPRVAALVVRRMGQVISQRLRKATGMLADYLE